MPGKYLAVIDTSILVSLFLNETADDHANRAEQIVNENREILVLPSLVVLEIIANSDLKLAQSLDAQARNEAVRETLRKLAKLKLRTVDLTPKVSRLAARLIPDCNIKAPDAVVVATAQAFGIPTVYTWDQKLINATSKLGEITKVTEPPIIAQPTLGI